jgi:hypothetical protein
MQQRSVARGLAHLLFSTATRPSAQQRIIIAKGIQGNERIGAFSLDS